MTRSGPAFVRTSKGLPYSEHMCQRNTERVCDLFIQARPPDAFPSAGCVATWHLHAPPAAAKMEVGK